MCLSVGYLYDQIDPETIQRDDKLPMIEIKLDLVSVKNDDNTRHNEIMFIPPLTTIVSESKTLIDR